MDVSGQITLIVKAPNQKIADLTVECSLDWTVRRLKKHLSDVYPSRPDEAHQKLIYSGHLLQDESKLKDVLKQYEPNQTVYTVHLVCVARQLDPFSQVTQQTEGLRNRRPMTSDTSANFSDGTTVRSASQTSAALGSTTSTATSQRPLSQSSVTSTMQTSTAQAASSAPGTVDSSWYNYYYNLILQQQQGAISQPAFGTASSPINFMTQPTPSMYSSPFVTPSTPFYSPGAMSYPGPSYFPVGMMNRTYTTGNVTQTPEFVGTIPTAAATTPVTAASVGGVSYPAGSNLAMQASHWLTTVQQQQLLQQQLYTEYFNRFMHYFQAAGSNRQQILFPTPPMPGVVGSAANQQAAPNPAQEVPAGAAQPARAAGAGGQQAVRMNAQGGPVLDEEDDEEGNRDWLDWIYTFIRFSMLLCILYFYSTFSRFITALFFIIVFYMYQVGFFRMQRGNQNAVRQQPRQQQQQQQQEQQQPNANVEENERQNEEGGASAASNEEAAAAAARTESTAAAADNRPGALSLAWNCFVSFFLSLAPQAPPAVNAN